jgi:DMSO/TMAO reductase YedYZ heme-binding membrane subunit
MKDVLERVQGPRLFWLIAIALSVMCAAIVMPHVNEESVRLAIRATARTSLLLFALTFTASSLRKLWPTDLTTWLVRNRRYLGLSFAASHALHLGFIVTFARMDPSEFGAISPLLNRIVAGMAYVFIFALALTSSNRAVALLGAQRWKRLHQVGAHYIWLVFLLSFAKRVPENPSYAIGVMMLLLAMGLRLYARTARSPAFSR